MSSYWQPPSDFGYQKKLYIQHVIRKRREKSLAQAKREIIKYLVELGILEYDDYKHFTPEWYRERFQEILRMNQGRTFKWHFIHPHDHEWVILQLT